MTTLSRPSCQARAEREPEREAGVAVRDAAGVQHLLGAVEQPADVDAHQRGRARARTATAPSSGRRSSAHPRTTRSPRACAELFERGAGIGDHDRRACRRAPRRSRSGDRVSSVPPDFDETTKSVRSRSSESASRRIAFGCVVSRTWKRSRSNARRSTSGARLDPPIPSRTTSSTSVGGLGQLAQLVEPLAHPQRLVEPAEPLRLVRAGPDGRVALPDPLDELAGLDHAAAFEPCNTVLLAPGALPPSGVGSL